MNDHFVPRIGAVLSADIAVPDHAQVVQFYRDVLRTGDEPLWDDDLNNNLGMPVIGLGERVKEYEHLPLEWMIHIQVADVAASVERALSLGGREVMHGKADDGSSQWAVLLDPNGAAFGLIPVPPPPATDGRSSDAPAAVGRIAWVDLTVPNAAATRDFYRLVIGWSVEDVDMKHDDETYADYCMVADGNVTVAGICHARGTNQGLPPVWMLYLPVGDLAESLRRVEAGGGEVVRASRGDDDEYTSAVIRDPTGACLALVR